MAHVTGSTSSALHHNHSSWGAIFAGVAMAVVVHILLSVLGIAIGVSTIDPLEEGNPVAGIGIGAAIYGVIAAVLSMFAGGFTAGSLSNIQGGRDRTLHGLTTWAVVTIVTFMLLTTVVGKVIGGTANLVATGLEKVGQATSAVMQPVAEEIGEQMREADIDIDLATIRREVRALVKDAEAPELQPQQVEQDAEQITERVTQDAKQAARNPGDANEQMQMIFDRIQNAMQEKMNAADTEALVNVLVSRTDMSEEEAQQAVDNWQQTYQEAYQAAQEEFESIREEAEQTAREWAAASADAVAAAAWWTFLMLVLTALAAAFGANVGSNRREVVVRS